jgi:hypothetical protein
MQAMSGEREKTYVLKGKVQLVDAYLGGEQNGDKTGRSSMPGTTTFSVEVTNVSGNCVWLLTDDEELALPYSEFPWFKAATIQQVINVLRPTADHLYWPDLDIDLSVESIRHPEKFPLKAKSTFQPCPSPEPPPAAI